MSTRSYPPWLLLVPVLFDVEPEGVSDMASKNIEAPKDTSRSGLLYAQWDLLARYVMAYLHDIERAKARCEVPSTGRGIRIAAAHGHVVKARGAVRLI